jgi:hypothetical protein
MSYRGEECRIEGSTCVAKANESPKVAIPLRNLGPWAMLGRLFRTRDSMSVPIPHIGSGAGWFKKTSTPIEQSAVRQPIFVILLNAVRG